MLTYRKKHRYLPRGHHGKQTVCCEKTRDSENKKIYKRLL